MYIYDVLHKDKVYQSIVSELRTLGVKYRLKKTQTSITTKFEAKPSSSTSRDQNVISNLNNRGTSATRVFKIPLSNLPQEVVNINEGAIIYVPTFIIETVAFLIQNITLEGLFRKAGSQIRQRELINRIDNGASLGDKYNPIDVANCLKTFIRNLPEPLIPFCYHDLFVRCTMLKSGKEQALLMACLLLPIHHLNTLAFLMGFLKNVARYERENKMGVDNIAKIFGPNIMPLQETTMVAMQSRLDAHLAIVKILIENADQIGIIPEQISENLSAEFTGSTDIELHNSQPQLYTKYKKKKHRSGSLTRKPHLSASNLNLRMFSGLKKIVGRNNSPTGSETPNNLETSDLCLYSPSLKMAKKRKVESTNETFHTKKTSVRDRSPFSKVKINKMSTRNNGETRMGEKLDKKMRLSLEKLVHKGKNKIGKNGVDKYKVSESPCIERRWSSASNSCSSPRNQNIKRKDSLSLGSLLQDNETKSRMSVYDDDIFMHADVNLSDDSEDLLSSNQAGDLSKAKRVRVNSKRRSLNTLLTDRARTRNASKHKLESLDHLYNHDIKRTKSIDSVLPRYRHIKEDDSEYVRVRKRDYEDIKNRVSAIETRISQEFDNVIHNSNTIPLGSVNNVQSEYEKTLEEADIENTLSADHLAKKMSKELKIRRSAEHKIFRSPSARKIGTIRRRSQEKIPRRRVNRTASWHSSDRSTVNTPLATTPSNNHNYSPSNGILKFSTNNHPIISSCSDETNARLEYLQEQLQTLISQTVEHTRTPVKDESPNTFSPRFTPETPKGNMNTIYRTPDTTKYFNHKISELKRSQKQSESAKKNNQSENWQDAGKYFSVDGTLCTTPVPQTGRASVAKLRTQNAGMVLAKAKLFDSTQEQTPCLRKYVRNQDKSNISNTLTPPIPPPRQKRKIHSPKTNNSRGRSSVDSEKSSLKTVSVYQKENETMSEQENCKTPHIKKPLLVRTPRSAKIVRRPAVEIKRTPMKAVPITTPKRQSPVVRSRHHK